MAFDSLPLFLPRRPVPRERFRELIRQPNHPLHWPDRRIGLMWSAKAGCTLAIKWFFHQQGLLEEALEYSTWIHHYRVRVYCHSEAYRLSCLRAARGGFRYIKVVRNPYQRAVGSFLHFVKTQGAKEFHQPFDQFLGRDLDDPPGVKFSEFVSFLESIDLQNCDIHYRLQEHPLEREGLVKVPYVIRLENLGESLPALERSLGLHRSPLRELGQSHHHTRQNAQREFCGDSPLALSPEDSYPGHQYFYNTELKERIARLYQNDFSRYGFDHTTSL